MCGIFGVWNQSGETVVESALRASRDTIAHRGLARAVRRSGVFHLWTHPQNLGIRIEEALAGLEAVFGTVCRYRDEGLLDVLSMAALTERVNQAHPIGRTGGMISAIRQCVCRGGAKQGPGAFA